MDIIAAVLILVISLIIAICFIRLLIFITPKIINVISRRRCGIYSYYSPTKQRFIGYAKAGILDNVPFLLIGTLIQLMTLILSLFIMRKTVLKSVEEAWILGMLLFPFCYSFAIIFRINLAVDLFGQF